MTVAAVRCCRKIKRGLMGAYNEQVEELT